MLWLSLWSQDREGGKAMWMRQSKVRLGRRASGERAQLSLSWMPDRLGRSTYTPQPLPSTFTYDIVPGGGGDRGIGEGLAGRHCPHRAWLLCSTISQWALVASRERLNEARTVWRTKAAGQHPALWSIPALFRPQSQTFLFHLAFLSPGRPPFSLNLPPTMDSLTKLWVLYSLPVTKGERFQRKGSGAWCLLGPWWGDRYQLFQSPSLDHNPTAATSTSVHNKGSGREVHLWG